MAKMTNVVVDVDKAGRLLIPKTVRDKFSTQRFLLETEKDEITLKPLKSWEELFVNMPELRQDQLKKLRKEEAEHG
ncbi:MAG TPA: AbrB/MazE/SpoVT family DNA-binding domain-containing protein [Candidatus Norongarragalinales archaeon]|nr:AbrB/MazE/SpoVT family DNA-binding domain-containing protein [Candidatus Norongarragalinales archaeon]